MRKLLKKSIARFFIFFLVFPFFAATRVVSPVEGNWGNRQSLVLNVSDGADCFYSYSGTDPLTSGFAYDGPVLIDAEGDVTVRIVCVKGSSREEYQISYQVSRTSSAFDEGSLEQNFISTISANPLFPFESGDMLTIPSTLYYSMGDGNQPKLNGTVLSLAPENRLSRYIPCVVTDGTSKWRFVLFLSGGEAGTFAKKEVPFSITNWTEFTWKGENLIYQIDDGLWSADKNPKILDRSVSHVISWQSVAYEAGNPVQRFTLPQRPALEVRSKETGRDPVTFTLNGDAGYRMEVISSGAPGDFPISNGLYYQTTFDTFAGDAIGGEAVFAVFYDGVYQGELTAPYLIDKKPPQSPKIISSVQSVYARKPVELNFESDELTSVYYAVSAPVFAPSDKTIQELRARVENGAFLPYDGSKITLESKDNRAVFFKVAAYACDAVGNRSQTTEYSVIIDEFDYYLVSGSDDDGADGSRLHPFGTVKKALEAINGGKYAHFYVSGTFEFPEGEQVISSNCTFEPFEDGVVASGVEKIEDSRSVRFIFPCDSSLVLRSASLVAEGCTFEKAVSAEGKRSTASFFKLENAVMNLSDCEIVGVFDTTGTIFSAASSVLDLQNTGITVQGASYACCVSAAESKVTAKKSRFTAIAKTAVDFSVNGGLFELRDNTCKVIAHLGRIAELTKTNARYTGNTFSAELESSSKKVSAVWKDEESLILEDSENQVTGF